MDAADRAQEQIEREEAALAALRDRPMPYRAACEFCKDCGGPIEQERKRAVPGCCRCASCARDYEREVRR